MTHDHFFQLANQRIAIDIRRHANSRRMVLRYQPLRQALSLTLPRRVSIAQGLRFVESKRRWIEHELAARVAHVPFADGQSIPLAGVPHLLVHVGGRGLVRVEDGQILVPGDASFMARRVREWLMAQARMRIVALAQHYAAALGVPYKRISLRDTSSRWGSCSHDGALSFSWRLIFAPDAVLDYVVCHEVAHLREHNHSEAFWAVVEGICPDYERHRWWLKKYGGELYVYG